MLDRGYLFISYWSGGPRGTKKDRLLPLLLTRWQDPISEDTIHLNAGEINYDWTRKLN